MRLDFYCSYQDLCEYRVFNQPGVERIEVYRSHPFTNEYMEKTFNHCGDPTAFERNVLSRQDGAVIRYAYVPGQHSPRWTPELYRAFADALKANREAEEKKWAAICERNGYDPNVERLDPPKPIPAPKYWDEEAKRYQTEPWYTEQTAAA